MKARSFPEVRQTSRRVLALFVVVDYLLVTLIILLFASGLLVPLVKATGGLVNRTLMANLLIMMPVGVVLVMLQLGKLRAADVGLVGSKLVPGALFAVGLWGLVQLAELALGLVADGTVTPAPEWSQLGVTTVVGYLLGQLFGNSLYEDIAYRGFLLPQVLSRLNGRWSGHAMRGLVVALILTQGLFALRHIPGDIFAGYGPTDIALDLPRLLVVGAVYALLYLRTRNLFLVIGAHAIGDAQTSLFAPTFLGPSDLVLLFVVLTLLAWPLFSRKEGKHPQPGSLLSSQHS